MLPVPSLRKYSASLASEGTARTDHQASVRVGGGLWLWNARSHGEGCLLASLAPSRHRRAGGRHRPRSPMAVLAVRSSVRRHRRRLPASTSAPLPSLDDSLALLSTLITNLRLHLATLATSTCQLLLENAALRRRAEAKKRQAAMAAIDACRNSLSTPPAL